MRFLFAVFFMFVSPMAPAAAATPAEETAKAQQSATAWLKLLDSGQFGKSWDGASRFWKTDHTREKTERVLKEQRAPNGKLLSRQVTSAEFLTVPDGDCIHVEYKSSFANKRSAREFIDMLREENGEWRVASWSWRSVD